MTRTLAAVAPVAAALILLAGRPSAVVGQQPLGHEVSAWAELAAAPGVDTAAVAWLRANVRPAEGDTLLSLVRALSRPDAAQLLISWFEADPSYAYLKAWPELRELVEAELATLRERAPEGAAGLVHVAYALARIRDAILDRYRELPWYRTAFTGDTLHVPAAPSAPAAFELELDFGPAAALLDVVGTADMDATAIRRRLEPHQAVFDALLSHRSQSFYPIALTREGLELSLERAAATSPLDRLYRFVFPLGLLHFAEVRALLPEYQRLVATLNEQSDAIDAYAAARIAPYMPEGLEFSRTVHFLFADGADGWVSDDIAAVDLEFLKDDYDQLLDVLIHETFHAVQAAARQPSPESDDRREQLLSGVLEALYAEGTATFIAPAQDLGDAERAELAERGRALLEELHTQLVAEPLDESAVGALRDRGIQGAGPFYWLGARMTEVIVETMGDNALAESLERGGIHFARLYLDALERYDGTAPEFSPALARSIRGLP